MCSSLNQPAFFKLLIGGFSSQLVSLPPRAKMGLISLCHIRSLKLLVYLLLVSIMLMGANYLCS